MQSKLEKWLMTSVGSIFKTVAMWSFGWAITPVSAYTDQAIVDIKMLFFDEEEEIEGFDDNQLAMLGLDVGAINDDERYWDYNTRGRRGR